MKIALVDILRQLDVQLPATTFNFSVVSFKTADKAILSGDGVQCLTNYCRVVDT
jgi:hypothetical protein